MYQLATDQLVTLTDQVFWPANTNRYWNKIEALCLLVCISYINKTKLSWTTTATIIVTRISKNCMKYILKKYIYQEIFMNWPAL